MTPQDRFYLEQLSVGQLALEIIDAQDAALERVRSILSDDGDHQGIEYGDLVRALDGIAAALGPPPGKPRC